ncbi:hypothetical protein ARMGADRAFT_1087984 [Armillaria gallica]|uniref:Uncharacterized protein n=1 Tax=Armillaria gallica TaxID=47427 RepID=A0A2H3D053_ARMGA|nr:hypothetical protein ARMGADRAFT_1087984 [Armillaria gallica]
MPVKKTFLGRWKLAFKKEVMEALPEQGTLLSNLLTMPTFPQDPPAIPPIQHNPLLPLMQQTWQGTSYDSAWASAGNQEHQCQSNLPATVLGIHPPIPPLGSTFSGITSTFCTLPSSPGEEIPTDPVHLTRSTPPSRTGMSPYESSSNLPLPQAQDQPQSSHSEQRARLRRDSPHPDLPGEIAQGKMYTGPRSSLGGTPSPSRSNIPETEWQRRQHELQNSGESTRKTEVSPLPSTSPAATPAPWYSLLQNISMATHGEALTPPRPLPPRKLPTPPRQGTPLTLERVLYLLSTGKLTAIPEILFCAPLIDLFNHFVKELVEDPDWARTPAEIDYTHYGYSYILKEEARHLPVSPSI